MEVERQIIIIPVHMIIKQCHNICNVFFFTNINRESHLGYLSTTKMHILTCWEHYKDDIGVSVDASVPSKTEGVLGELHQELIQVICNKKRQEMVMC